jgi:hypothetical protein
MFSSADISSAARRPLSVAIKSQANPIHSRFALSGDETRFQQKGVLALKLNQVSNLTPARGGEPIDRPPLNV